MAIATRTLHLYLMTPDGLVRSRVDPDIRHAEVTGQALQGEHIRGIARDPFNPRHLYAVSITDVYTSEDGGDSWRWLPAGGLQYREMWALAVHPTRPNEIYVGTLPAAIFVSQDGGLSFRELTAFRELPDYSRWTFPPPPHVAHIRGFALCAEYPDDILVGIEEGGVALSHDRGETWQDISGPRSDIAFPPPDPTGLGRYQMGQLEPGRVYRDVHNVARDVTDSRRMYATTGLGTFRTDDGATWKRLEYGMVRAYAVPLAIHPARPDRVFIGAAENGPPAWKGFRTPRPGPYNVSRYNTHGGDDRGALPVILRSDDRGENWRRLENGLPQAYPYMACMMQAHPSDPDTVFMCYTDGRVFVTTNAGEEWHELLASPTTITSFGLGVFEG